MSLESLTYLTVNAITEGVGSSQVLGYIERFAQRGLDVTLHSFEKQSPPTELATRLTDARVDWRPQPFGRSGAIGGFERVARGAKAIRGAPLVHARSDLPAASAMLARCPTWLWDVRSLWADQRIALGLLAAGSAEARILRAIERRAADESAAIVTLSRSVIDVLVSRYGEEAVGQTVVVPTCVDLGRFPARALPEGPVRFLLSGTMNTYYDVPTMLSLVKRFQFHRSAELVVLSPAGGAWEHRIASAASAYGQVPPGEVPAHVAAAHVGLSVCRVDAGVSLRAAMPTKIAEFLATGRPVVVNRGLGDMDAIIGRYRCGVVLDPPGELGLDKAVAELCDLLADPEIVERCRAAAEDHFDIERGVDRLLDVYERMAARKRSWEIEQ